MNRLLQEQERRGGLLGLTKPQGLEEPAGITLGAPLRRPAKEGRERGQLLIALRAGSAPHRRFPTRHPVSRKRSAVLADPLRASSGGPPRLR